MNRPRHRPPEISGKLRGARKSLGLTLDQLAQRSGVSKSVLSQIERGQTNPTFATLWNLTQTLGIDIQSLIEHDMPTSGRVSIERVAANLTPTIFSADGLCVLRILSPADRASDMEWYQLTVQAGGELCSEPHAPDTWEHLSVLQGRLQVESGGDEIDIGEGETARYPAFVPHRIANPGATVAIAFLVVLQHI